MQYNSAQKAQQALELLAGPGEYIERLRAAYGNLILAGGPDYAEDSAEITEAYKKTSAAVDHENWSEAETGIREMIQEIFMEEGANQVRALLDVDLSN
jgi:hypothetical protein